MLAITGTPGVGKTRVGQILKKRGYKVIDLNKIAKHYGCLLKDDEVFEIDIETLAKLFNPKDFDVDFVEGHLSHYIADRCVVLRCRPDVLKRRMENKGWSEEKILENIEAEIIDYILVEALNVCHEVHEIDTTFLKAEDVATIVEGIYRGGKKYPAGKIDWINELGNRIDDFIRKL